MLSQDNTTTQITETDPKKLREQLQETHIELQQCKVKLETTTQVRYVLSPSGTLVIWHHL